MFFALSLSLARALANKKLNEIYRKHSTAKMLNAILLFFCFFVSFHGTLCARISYTHTGYTSAALHWIYICYSCIHRDRHCARLFFYYLWLSMCGVSVCVYVCIVGWWLSLDSVNACAPATFHDDNNENNCRSLLPVSAKNYIYLFVVYVRVV